MQLTHHLPFHAAAARTRHHAARLAQRIASAVIHAAHREHGWLCADVPPEPHLWAEMAPDLALRRISRQAEALHTAALEGRH